jgi:hypothetical protein
VLKLLLLSDEDVQGGGRDQVVVRVLGWDREVEGWH